MLPIRSTKLSIQPKDLDLALTYRAQIVQSEEGKGGEEEERRGREEEVGDDTSRILSPEGRRQTVRDRIGFVSGK